MEQIRWSPESTCIAPARWEYRVFSDDLEKEGARLSSGALSHHGEQSEDAYLVSRSASDVAVKLRAGRFEAKELLALRNSFELWCPVLKNSRRISLGFLLAEVVSHPVTDLDVSPDDLLQVGQIDNFVDHAPGLEMVVVKKERTKLTHEHAISEFVRLTVCGRRLQSVAVESQDMHAVACLLNEIDLAARPNQNYAAFLRGVVFA